MPTEIEVPEIGSSVQTELASSKDASDLLDAGFAHRELVVRNWHAGERFWPAHTKEPRKIKELLQDRHVTGEQKRSWPVIASGGEVGWMTNRFDNGPSPGTLWSASGFLGADTLLGPGFLGFGYGGDKHWSVYLLLGVP